jgi:hypothetical protein
MSDILHSTATKIASLSGIVTKPRFLELTAKTPVDLLDEVTGQKIAAHLSLLATEYHNTVNDIIATIENNQEGEFLNAREIAEAASRKITDRHSKETWTLT